MRRLVTGVLSGLWMVIFTAFASAQQVVVSAAASLKPALEEIAKLPARPAVTFNFGGSGALQQQIEHGAPVDVFISASPQQVDALEKSGLIARETRKDLLKNELVLIAPKAKTGISSFDDLARTEVKTIAIGEPKSVPVGSYAFEVFAQMKLLDAIQKKLVFMLDARQVLSSVEQANADAGLVYVSDAQDSQKVKVVARAPEGSHSPIVYSAAVLENSAHRREAENFVKLLFSPEAAAIFRRHGFVIAP